MRLNLSDILKRIGGYVDQDSSSTPTGSDLTDRINYVNRALDEWASTYDWDVLSETHNPSSSTVSSTSFGLPTNFRKPMSALYYYENDPPTEYKLVPRHERFTIDPTEEFAYIDGNTSDGFALVVPKGLPSGASMAMDIQVYPSALVTLADMPVLEDAEYLVDRGISYVLEARGDSRFPLMKAEADRKLATLIERENAKNIGMDNQIPQDRTFRIGRD